MEKVKLSSQETIILSLIAEGFTRKFIADKLNIPYPRCLRIVKHIQEKFDTTNLIECVVKAYKGGYINRNL